ncbi:helix-turn-helix transcriptional regulator [Sinomicrobium sp. M5D2P17]
MVNTEDFSSRLQEVLDFYGLSASSFADKIGVQRSSISHILSGRNKPSLDFVLKILHAFSEVELYWLLNGKGVFPADKQVEKKKEVPQAKIQDTPDLFSSPSGVETLPAENSSGIPDKEVERIVFFYKDGTFKEYRNYKK